MGYSVITTDNTVGFYPDIVVYPARDNGWDYWLQQPEGAYYTYVTVCESPKEESDMRKLYEVFVVDPKTEEMWIRFVIAKSNDGAKHKVMKESGLTKDYDDYDMESREVMMLREEKEVQEVKIVKE